MILGEKGGEKKGPPPPNQQQQQQPGYPNRVPYQGTLIGYPNTILTGRACLKEKDRPLGRPIN